MHVWGLTSGIELYLMVFPMTFTIMAFYYLYSISRRNIVELERQGPRYVMTRRNMLGMKDKLIIARDNVRRYEDAQGKGNYIWFGHIIGKERGRILMKPYCMHKAGTVANPKEMQYIMFVA